MTAKELFETIIKGDSDKVSQKIEALKDVNKENAIIGDAVEQLEIYLLNHMFKDDEEKHELIRNIAFLCSLNPYYEFMSKKYYDIYVHMLIDMEISKLQVEEDYFFSFRSINMYSIQEIINNTISVSSPKTFNDPLDPPITLAAKNKFKNIKTQKDEQFFLEALEKVRIRCFVPARDPKTKTKKKLKPYLNTLMWAHYANSHKGMCIKYKLSPSLIKRTDKTTGIFAAVEYPKGAFNINSHDIFEFNECFLTKQSEWKYEKEVRLIYFNADNSDYFQPLKLDDDNRIEAIYFGYNCSETDKKTIKKLFTHDSTIKFYQMEIDYSNIFRLKAIEETEKSEDNKG